jgi:hypothetical protein
MLRDEMIRLLLILALLMPSLSFALQPEKDVLQNTIEDISAAEKKSLLRVWSWVGFVKGNDDYDSLHKIHKRSTFIAHNENTEKKDHFVIIWFHGMGGYKRSSFDGVFHYLVWLNNNSISHTWIMPELPWSANASNINNRHAWTKKDSFKDFVDSALKKTPTIMSNKKIHIIIAGHSRGGKSIAWAARTGGLCKVSPAWIIWSDSTYGNWLQDAWSYCLKDAPVFMEIFYLKNTGTQASVKRFEKINNSKLVEIHQLSFPWYHGKIGNSVFYLSNAFEKLFTK